MVRVADYLTEPFRRAAAPGLSLVAEKVYRLPETGSCGIGS